jgi:signal transduction histidine kinase
MSTNNGVSKFDRQRHIFTNYSTDDGLSGNDLTGFGECYESPHGEMFFGGFAGATGFYPSKVVDTVNEPKIVLTDFRLFDVPVKVSPGSPLQRTITLTDELTLSHGSNSLSVGFAAINFAHSTEIRYRYKLAGLDESWHVVDDSRNVASYTALPPSKYTFVVQESVRGHPWSEPGTALQINILPAWWNTWWFRTVYATVIVVLMSIAYRFRLNQIAAQLQVRMDERLRERNRIARELHDTLLQGFQGLVLRFQAVVKTLPTGSAGHRMMEEALDRADNVLLEGRRRVQDLRDEGSTGTDLADALAQYGKELAEGSGVGFSVSIIGQPHPLDPIIRDEVYCIEREAMANAFRHSRAAKIEVEITYTDVIRLTVRDDGVGIDQKILDGGRAGHWGLSGMRERAQSIGADLNLWSHPAAGTEVELIVRAKVAHQARLQGSR